MIELKETIVRRSGEESEDDDDVDHVGNEEDEDEHGCNEGYESEDDSGEDTEDQGPAPPSKRTRLSRVYFSVREHAGTREPGSQEPFDLCKKVCHAKLDIKK